MTREEAVNELNDRIKSAEYVDSDYIDCVSVDAVKMAISALSVSETNVGDTISRQAAIRWVKTECNPYGNPTLDFESGKKVIEHLEQMPTIDAEPETRWIPVTERLPGKHRSAIVTDFGHVTLAYTNNSDEWTDYDGNRLKNVTAWMPLPEPYSGVKQ